MTLGHHKAVALEGRHGNSLVSGWRPLFEEVMNREPLIHHEQGPRVILMSSGTGEGGPCAFWLPELIRSKENIVAMTGYCASSTIGSQLLELSAAPLDQRKLHNGEITWKGMGGSQRLSIPVSLIQASITCLKGYSAHGDQSDLVNWLFENHRGEVKQVLAGTVFLQHGDDRARSGLEKAILDRSDDWSLDVQVVKPRDSEQWFDLESDRAKLHDDLSHEELEKEISRLQAALVSLKIKAARVGHQPQ